MAWIALLIAGLCEVGAVYSMNRAAHKKVDGYIFMIVFFGASLALLSYAMRTIPMGTAYAIWTGVGTAGATIMGMLLFNEAKDWRRFLFIGIIIASVVGLKLVG
ncbi:Multidrug resistance protein YkkD [Metalysinibacillus saudimassiliensis]|uniref:Multidrug resistance protein YkkD n=1 Tax=Metalysinibacillus saudimassiliensis TaxID=1461583 RepID=A0A078M6Z9_9BACL|nr:Multidrug resistance protein YkkD [Metalysinibacillus saudimassiliensis]